MLKESETGMDGGVGRWMLDESEMSGWMKGWEEGALDGDVGLWVQEKQIIRGLIEQTNNNISTEKYFTSGVSKGFDWTEEIIET